MNRTLSILFLLLGSIVLSCSADCKMKLNNLTVVESKRLLCAQISLLSDKRDIQFSHLELTVTGTSGKDYFNIKLTNNVCHEELQFTEHKKVIHICGTIPSNIKSLHGMYISKATVLTSIVPLDQDDDCTLEFERTQSFIPLIQGSVREDSQCQSNDDKRIATWCASHLMGESSEFCCSNRNTSSPCSRTEVDDKLVLLRAKVFTINFSRVICVQFVPSFSSPDVKTFAMHHDNERRSSLHMEVSYDNKTAVPYLLGNHYCLGDILPEMKNLDHADKKKVTLCTSKLTGQEDITLAHFFRLTGVLRYSITTASSNRLEKIKSVDIKFPKIMFDAKTKDYCELNAVRRQCPKCEQTCPVMLDGMGFLKCQEDWYWYPSNLSREPTVSQVHQKVTGDMRHHSSTGDHGGDDPDESVFSHQQGQNKGSITRGWEQLIWMLISVTMLHSNSK